MGNMGMAENEFHEKTARLELQRDRMGEKSMTFEEALAEAAKARAEFERAMLRIADSIAGKLTAEFGDEITVTYELGPGVHDSLGGEE